MEVFSPAGVLLVAHRLSPPGAGEVVRTAEHRAALEKVVLAQFSTARPCDRKANRPPGTERLLAVEVDSVDERRRAALGRFAALPSPFTLADFDYTAQPSVDAKLIADLGTLRFSSVAERASGEGRLTACQPRRT